MDEIVIYEKSTCSKCRVAIQILNEHGAPYRTVVYHDAPLTKEKLTELVGKIGITPRELLRTNEPLYRELHLRTTDMSDEEIIAAMVEHPDLIQRPILERGDRAIIGRPSERITEFLKEV